VIEVDLLAHHRLRLDDLASVVPAANLEGDPVRIPRVAGMMDNRSGRLRRALKLAQVVVQAILDPLLGGFELLAEHLELDFLDRRVAVASPVALVARDIGREPGVGQSGLVAFAKGRDHVRIRCLPPLP
jgi:hypothetical protein